MRKIYNLLLSLWLLLASNALSAQVTTTPFMDFTPEADSIGHSLKTDEAALPNKNYSTNKVWQVALKLFLRTDLYLEEAIKDQPLLQGTPPSPKASPF